MSDDGVRLVGAACFDLDHERHNPEAAEDRPGVATSITTQWLEGRVHFGGQVSVRIPVGRLSTVPWLRVSPIVAVEVLGGGRPYYYSAEDVLPLLILPTAGLMVSLSPPDARSALEGERGRLPRPLTIRPGVGFEVGAVAPAIAVLARMTAEVEIPVGRTVSVVPQFVVGAAMFKGPQFARDYGFRVGIVLYRPPYETGDR